MEVVPEQPLDDNAVTLHETAELPISDVTPKAPKEKVVKEKLKVQTSGSKQLQEEKRKARDMLKEVTLKSKEAKVEMWAARAAVLEEKVKTYREQQAKKHIPKMLDGVLDPKEKPESIKELTKQTIVADEPSQKEIELMKEGKDPVLDMPPEKMTEQPDLLKQAVNNRNERGTEVVAPSLRQPTKPATLKPNTQPKPQAQMNNNSLGGSLYRPLF